MIDRAEGLSRRQFLAAAISTGAALTVPQFLLGCASPARRSEGSEREAHAVWSDYPVARAAAIAVTAPNPHNAQPWKLRFDSPESLTLYVDATRLLPDTDPPARQIHIGQGTFLELLRLAAANFGHTAEIRLFPQGTYGLAEIGKRPVATVKLTVKPDILPDPLFAFWQKRMTDRSEYSGPDLSADEFAKLTQLTGARAATLSFIAGAELQQINESIYRAMEIEMNDAKCADETFHWFRFSDSEIAEKADGLNLRGNGMSGMKLWLARTFFVAPEKASFQSRSNTEAYLKTFRSVVDSNRGIALFTTATNGPTDWVRTGFDYMRFHLAVTSLGLAMQPVSQVLQEYAAMDKLRGAFEDTMQIRAPRKIQMMVRLGRSDYRYFAPRRAVKDLLI